MGTLNQNPKIKETGNASINATEYCIWETNNGATSTLNIVNTSLANVLTVAITNAPVEGIIARVNGNIEKSINGIWELPPNSPSMSIQAIGNFLGKNVTITNITSASKDAMADINCVVS